MTEDAQTKVLGLVKTIPWTVLAFTLVYVLVQYVLVPANALNKQTVDSIASSSTKQTIILEELKNTIQLFVSKVPYEHGAHQQLLLDMQAQQQEMWQKVREDHKQFGGMQ